MVAQRASSTFCPNRWSRSGRQLHQKSLVTSQFFSIWRTTAGPPPEALGGNSVTTRSFNRSFARLIGSRFNANQHDMLSEKRGPNVFEKAQPQGVRHFFFQPHPGLTPSPDHPHQVKDRAGRMRDDFDHLETGHSEQLLERSQAEKP